MVTRVENYINYGNTEKEVADLRQRIMNIEIQLEYHKTENIELNRKFLSLEQINTNLSKYIQIEKNISNY